MNNDSAGSIFFTDHHKTVSTDRVKAALEQSELDPELVRELAKRFCFSRAKNCLKSEGMLDEVNETIKMWTFQLSERYRQFNKLNYEYSAQFWFDKGSETIGSDNPKVLEQVNSLFAHYGAVYLPSDVSKLVRRIFAQTSGMVPLRKAGVVYFVPSENARLMNRVREFISQMGGSCTVIDIVRQNKPVVEKVTASLVDTVKSDLAKIAEEMTLLRQADKTFTDRVANNRWKELLNQVERIKMFSRSLHVDTTDLINKVRSTELDLALVTGDSLDIIAALAQAGKITGTLGEIAKGAAKVAFPGDLPSINSPRVRQFMDTMPDVGGLDLPVFKNVVKRDRVLAEV